jgi:hypothetical protein
MFARIFALSLLLCALAVHADADERLRDIACRSVHLGYPGKAGTVFYNEMAIDQSAPGSYFMVCGWNKGYFGMQELADGKKLLIFSVWDDARGDDPNAVNEDRRVKLLYNDPDVRIGRFGGEGTGGQSFYDYAWKLDQPYRFLVAARIAGDRTEYTGFFFHPETSKWKRLVTFSTVTGGKPLGGYYSFVEDFKRDRVSTTHARTARFKDAAILDLDGSWQPLLKARFTADANPVENIDAGLKEGWFYLTTGGKTVNSGTKLRETMEAPAATTNGKPEVPGEIAKAISELK